MLSPRFAPLSNDSIRYLPVLATPDYIELRQTPRAARKFRGRLFAVNYRKAPQYPWPCPL